MTDYSFMTGKGERANNEDCVRVVDKGSFKAFILADGLGGHGNGEIASAAAVSAVENFVVNNDFNENMLNECFIQAQKGVFEAQEVCAFDEMRTTLVVLIINDNKAYWGHIGDSRLYVFDGIKCDYRTSDHSIPQLLLNMGEIEEKEIRHHSERNKLLKALGSPASENDELYSLGGENIDVRGKSFLICSDGFWEWIEEKDMEKYLKKSKDADSWLKTMADKVVDKGCGKNMDNLSAITIIC